ncbi:hypothetical protein K0U00_33890, partial [Paenibacillus sepulcri]|nr:hypothetical protein [Paenibacillus sepulcri]
MKTKQMIVALGILLVVSSSTAIIVSAAKAAPAGNVNTGNEADKRVCDAKGGPPSRPAKGVKASVPPAGGVKAPHAADTDTETSAGTANGTTAENGDTSVVISGGFDTDPVDHGRPVVLIAAALGVPTEVFREAFSGVTPAGAGSGGPTAEEAQQNKAALLKVLGSYGITNERLDEVSNYYRY